MLRIISGGSRGMLGCLGAALLFALVVSGSSVEAGAQTAEAARYTVTDLGVLAGSSSSGADAINDSGQVAGWSGGGPDAGDTHGFLWENGEMTDLGALGGGDYSHAFDVNEDGRVVGESSYPVGPNGNGPTKAFRWQNGQMTDLGALLASPDEDSHAYAIDGSGQVVGKSLAQDQNGSFWNHAFLYSGGAMTDLGTLGPSGSPGESAAYGINASGQVVGEADLEGFAGTHAFLWEDGQMQDLGTLDGENYSVAYDINDVGQVVGDSRGGFIWQDGAMTRLAGISPAAINDSGQVVGRRIGFGCGGDCITFHAAIWEDGESKDLNDLINPASGWELNEAADVNDEGQIVGSGTIDGETHAFLLMPDPDFEDPTPPSVEAGADAEIEAGGTFTGGGSFTDAGADDTHTATVDYGDGSGEQNLALNPDKTFSLSHAYADAGVYTVTVTVTDNGGAEDSDTLVVTVNETANTPAGTDVSVESSGVRLTFDNVTQAGDTTVTPIDPSDVGQLPDGFVLFNDQAYDISTTAQFSDDITVCFTVPNDTDEETFDTLSVLHEENGSLVDKTSSRYFDAKTICATVDSFSDFVVVQQVNQPPVANDDQTVTLDEGESKSFQLDASDPDGDTLAYDITNQPDKGTLTGTAPDLTYTTNDENYFGDDSFTYTADDGNDGSDFGKVTINVNPVNDKPSFELTADANQTVEENSTGPNDMPGSRRHTVANFATGFDPGPNESTQQVAEYIVTDADGNTVNSELFDVQPAVSNDGTLTYTLKENERGSIELEVKVRDGGGTDDDGVDTSDPLGFTITVTPAPDTTAPVLTVPTDITVDATGPGGATVNFANDVSATDNKDLSPNVVCAPTSGSTFPIGTTTVSCTATDDAGNESSESFTVRVKGASEQIGVLIAQIEDSNFKAQLKKTLTDKLKKAQKHLSENRTKPACGELDAFVKEVERHSSGRGPAGKEIPSSVAQQHIEKAEQIQAVVNCPAPPRGPRG